jgi:hypothetical protein
MGSRPSERDHRVLGAMRPEHRTHRTGASAPSNWVSGGSMAISVGRRRIISRRVLHTTTRQRSREIAAELSVAPRTVGAHVEHILARLGAGRRTEIASWVATTTHAMAVAGHPHEPEDSRPARPRVDTALSRRQGGHVRKTVTYEPPQVLTRKLITAPRGEVAERSIAAVLKTAGCKPREFESHPLRQDFFREMADVRPSGAQPTNHR